MSFIGFRIHLEPGALISLESEMTTMRRAKCSGKTCTRLVAAHLSSVMLATVVLLVSFLVGGSITAISGSAAASIAGNLLVAPVATLLVRWPRLLVAVGQSFGWSHVVAWGWVVLLLLSVVLSGWCATVVAVTSVALVSAWGHAVAASVTLVALVGWRVASVALIVVHAVASIDHGSNGV